MNRIAHRAIANNFREWRMMVKDFAIAGGQKAHGPEMITEIILHGPTPLPKELKSLDSKGRFSPINILNLLTE